MAKSILLGYGVVSINDQPIGLTRGGSTFDVEREMRPIEADGDRGPVKGRIAFDAETAILKVNALEIFTFEQLKTVYAGLNGTGAAGEGTLSTEFAISDDDYVTVKWQGKTLDGAAITVELNNAINLGGLSFAFADKDEVVPELEFTGVYEEETRRDEPTWSIKFGKAETKAGMRSAEVKAGGTK